MTNTAQLQLLLRQSGYKLQHVARVLGVSATTLRNKLNGVTDFKLAEAEKLAALLELTPTQRELYFFGPAHVRLQERRRTNDIGTTAANKTGPAPLRDAQRQTQCRP